MLEENIIDQQNAIEIEITALEELLEITLWNIRMLEYKILEIVFEQTYKLIDEIWKE